MTEFHRMGSQATKIIIWFWGLKSKINARELGFYFEASSLASSCFCAHMISSSLMWTERGRTSSLVSLYLYVDFNPGWSEGSTLMTSSNLCYLLKAPTQIPSHGGLNLQYMNCQVEGNTDIPSTFPVSKFCTCMYEMAIIHGQENWRENYCNHSTSIYQPL